MSGAPSAPVQQPFTDQEWATILAMRAMPPGAVYDAAADALEHVLAERLGQTVRSFEIDEATLRLIDDLVRAGVFPTRGDMVGHAVRELLASIQNRPEPPAAPAESDEVPDQAEAPASIVVYPSSELETFSRRFSNLYDEDYDEAGPFSLELDGHEVQVPSPVAKVLRAVAGSLSIGQAVTVTAVPPD